jgi:hypothetical protein
MAYVYTCGKCQRPTDLPRKVAQVRCCGADIEECEEVSDAAADKRWKAWKAKQAAKIGEHVEKPTVKRKKGGGGA